MTKIAGKILFFYCKIVTKMADLLKICVLVPAYNPGGQLVPLVRELARSGFKHIVVVNDGSGAESKPVFDELEKMGNCHLLHHAVNLGKGRALKTGFNYCLLNFKDISGILTADADGQHLPEDIVKVAETFLKNPRKLVIGARRFGPGTPLRSLIGNTLTRYIFRFLSGKKISDTQSGLRCIPGERLPELIRLEGERYEYEMNVLVSAKACRMDMIEEPISTVYIEGNRSSHFNPLKDSMKIYFLLLRFSFSSVFASAIDFLVFTAAYFIKKDILVAMVIARLVSGNINFFMNKGLVFRNQEAAASPLIKYAVLFVVLAALSYMSIRTMAGFGINVILAKVMAETVLFMASFTIQRDYVFAGQANGKA